MARISLEDHSLTRKGRMASRRPFRPKPITDIFTNDMSIDRRKCQRVVPMKVLVLGLGRTGTTCMQANLIRSVFLSRPKSRFQHSPLELLVQIQKCTD